MRLQTSSTASRAGGVAGALAPPRAGAARRARAPPPAAAANGAQPAAAAAPALSASAPVTDAAVPEGHADLHGFLYGDGGAEEAHGSPAGGDAPYAFRAGEDDGSALLPVPAWLAARRGERPVGVYALYDTRRALQYVGYGRNVVLAVAGHAERLGADADDRCAYVRCMVFANRAMQSRGALEREAANWLAEAGTTPPGNGADAAAWAPRPPAAVMTPAERAAYEDKKLKMRKAMGENVGDAAPGEAPDAAARRAALLAAVEGDDWSAVIEAQTAGTLTGGAGARGGAAPPPPPVVSPFARAAVHRAVGEHPEQASPPARVEMTVAAVDAALDEVRPYLIADGGNVEVAGVADGVVSLRLQGACGSCASSGATMKMGIERALRATFGDALREVVQVGGGAAGAGGGPAPTTAEAVDRHLDVLRAAIASYGGDVAVLSVGGGAARLRYTGPKPIGYGIVAAVKDKFPDVGDVQMVDADGAEIQF